MRKPRIKNNQIYKITYTFPEVDKPIVYIGITSSTLKGRLRWHRTDVAKKLISGQIIRTPKEAVMAYSLLMGYEVKIEQVEPLTDRNYEREMYWILKHINDSSVICVNSDVAGRENVKLSNSKDLSKKWMEAIEKCYN